jgi:hypothetical protein
MAQLVAPVTFFGAKGKATVKALIDTGAEMSLISADVAKKIGAKIIGEVSVHGAGRAVVKVAKVSGIAMPKAMSCKTGPSLVWVFGAGDVFPGTGLKAILGYDFMQKARMQVAAFTATKAIRCVKDGR